MSLKKQALSGVKWTGIQQIGTQGIGFIISIVLARLLTPSEFGLIAMITVFIRIGNALLDSGLGVSIIRQDDTNEEDYATVFYFNLIVSILVYCIIYLTAPYIAIFYKQPVLVSLIRWLSLTLIINAFAVIQQTRLTKLMDFKTQTKIAIPSLLIGGIVGVSMAYLNFGVWSIVGFNISQAFVGTVQLWVYSKWKPIWAFSKEKFKEHFSFGYKLTISSLLDKIFTNVYTIVIGKFFIVEQVGYYQRANSLQMYPVGTISAVLGKVSYPLFAKIKEDNTKLKSAYRKILQMNIFLLAPTLIIAGVLAEPLFRFLFTEKWLPAVPYFRIILIVGIIYPIHSFNLNILNVKGRSDLFLKLEIIKKIMIIIAITIAIRFGILGLLYSRIVTSVLSFFINTHYSGRFIGYTAWQQIKDISPIIVLSLLVGFLVFIFDQQLADFMKYDILRLIFGGIVALLVYLPVAYWLKFDSLFEILTILKNKKLNE